MTPPSLDHTSLKKLFNGLKKPRTHSTKVMGLDEAICKHVVPGMTLHFAYSEGRPMATSNALVRSFAGTEPGFTVISAGLVSNQAALISEKIVTKLIVSFVGENYPTPAPNKIFQKLIDMCEVEIENNSLLALSQRLAAGAYGFPFALTKSWKGSSLAENKCFRTLPDPFGSGEEVGILSPLIPDITFVHGLAADEHGNIVLSPPFGEGEIAAFAAKKGVVATVERIVSDDLIERNSTLVRIPAHRVLSVSEVPFGCHPYGIYNPFSREIPAYVEDYESFAVIRAASYSLETFSEWVREWILDVADHDDYLAKLGAERLNNLRYKAVGDAWLEDLVPEKVQHICSLEGYDNREMMVVSAALAVEEKVKKEGYMIIEAGVGLANLAAWLAVLSLQQEDDIPAELVAEIGVYGYLPKGGEPFIFSNRNLPSSKSMTGVEAVLGLYVGGRHNNCVAIIGAGQIDAHGNINSTTKDDGGFLLGSGGANDITSSAADTIAITQQSKDRLVEALPYVTSPGKNVSTLVTDLGVFHKSGDIFELDQYYQIDGQGQEEAIKNIRKNCGWQLKISPSLKSAPKPSSDQLLRLRLFDIRNDFLKYSVRPMTGKSK